MNHHLTRAEVKEMDEKREDIDLGHEEYYDPYANWPKEKLGEPFFPYHVLKELSIIILVIAVVVTLASFFPFEMLEKADPFSTPKHIKPEWYFLAVYQFLKIAEKFAFLGSWAPKLIGIFGPVIAILLITLLPFIEKNPERHPSKRVFVVSAGIIFLLIFIILTIWGYYS
jgi:quinol-cytochrome oxidoreductase complex cytochrome b subunit